MRTSAKGLGALLVALAVVLVVPRPAPARESCGRVVIVTLPGVIWQDIERWRPPEISAAARNGAAGSVSVRTTSSRTSYASGFATIGAGARLAGGVTTGGVAGELPELEPALARGVQAAGVAELRALARGEGYAARPGALGSAIAGIPAIAIGNADLGAPAPLPFRRGRWTLLAAMNGTGIVDLAAVGSDLLREDPAAPFGVRSDPRALETAVAAALELSCGVTVVDQGDLIRADAAARVARDPLADARRRALAAVDALVGQIRSSLDFERDLLLVLSPTSRRWDPDVHLGVAIAEGPRFPAGSTLESASTRRRSLVTLPDVAPTVLAHLGIERPSSMNGRPWVSVPAAGEDRVADAIALDRESVFVLSIQGSISAGFVAFQVLVYAAATGLLFRRERRLREDDGGSLGTSLELAALAVVAFPVCTYLAGLAPAHTLGVAGFVAVLIAIDAALVAIVYVAARRPLDRLLAVTGVTTLLIAGDLLLGAHLQLNTVFGYSPIVGGRFAGIGNIAFAVLAGATLITGALIIHRYSGARAAVIGTAALFALVIVIDGAPQFGSDVGGVLALVPALGITWLLLTKRRPGVTAITLSIAGAVAALAAFLALDLARPPQSQTHLARLFEDVRERGAEVFMSTLERKAAANLRVFRSTIWTYFVPPALAVMFYLLWRPRGRWRDLALRYPRLRAGLVGGLVLGVLGFAVNDSGIVIPAVVLSFLVPLALVLHLCMQERAPS